MPIPTADAGKTPGSEAGPADRVGGDPLTILLACYEYPPIGGGGGVGAKQYAEAWASKGHEVTVLTSRAGGLPAREQIRGVNVVRVGTLGKKERATSTALSMLTYLVSGFVHLMRHRSSYADVQIVNTHFSLPTGPLGWAAAMLLSSPQLLTIIGGDIYDPSKASSPHRHWLLRVANRLLIDAADEVVAISSDTRKRAVEHYGIERDIQVINYGFAPPTADDIEGVDRCEGEGRFRLIAVGRLVPRKGFEYLIRALGQLPPDVHLWIVGDGPHEDELRAVAAEEGVEKRVDWLGYQSRARIYGLLRAADCFVLSSLHEGLGIVVQEAMWAGLPIVATDNGGQVDLVVHGRNGLLVPVADASALAGAVRSVRKDPETASRMADANRRDIQKYRVDTNSEEYVTLFRAMLDARGAATPVSGQPELGREA